MPRSRYVSFALPCGALYASFTGFCALGAHFPAFSSTRPLRGYLRPCAACANPMALQWRILPFLEFCVRWARGGGRKGKGNTFLPPYPMAYGILAFTNLLRMERPLCPPSVGVSRFTTPLQSPWLGRCFPDAALQYFAVLPWFVRGSNSEYGLPTAKRTICSAVLNADLCCLNE